MMRQTLEELRALVEEPNSLSQEHEVHNEIQAIQRAYRRTEKNANRKYQMLQDRILKQFDMSDTGTEAERRNTLRRAEIARDLVLEKARKQAVRQLRDLRYKSGKWAALVPLNFQGMQI